MKIQSFLAFLFTLFALLLLIGSVGYYFWNIPKPARCVYHTLDLKLETDHLEMQQCKGKLVKLYIKNGNSEDEYKISIDGPKWIIARPKKIRLEPNETGEIAIYVSPPLGTEGEFTSIITVKSWCVEDHTKLWVKV
ncbi:MAG: hypothetical protein J7J93_02560 [Candidatus Aenigmarchaeota archaeon]|nr:hypothetical protein [Candidatus Aenigmarchaeota archaeon]